jgi:CRP-like cAMP-binding protein
MSQDVLGTLTERLRAVPLFADLDGDSIGRVAAIVKDFDVTAGHVLIQPRTAGAGLFIIEAGTVAVTFKDKEIDLGPGDFVGEVSLLDDQTDRTARVTATTAVRGWCIPRDPFIELLYSEPGIALAMLRALAHRLAETDTL